MRFFFIWVLIFLDVVWSQDPPITPIGHPQITVRSLVPRARILNCNGGDRRRLTSLLRELLPYLEAFFDTTRPDNADEAELAIFNQYFQRGPDYTRVSLRINALRMRNQVQSTFETVPGLHHQNEIHCRDIENRCTTRRHVVAYHSSRNLRALVLVCVA